MPRKNLTGYIFNRLVVQGLAGTKKWKSGKSEYLWRCACRCGKEVLVPTASLTSGNTGSCGCFHVDSARAQGVASRVHGGRVNGARTPEYATWFNMIQRCTNPRNSSYKNYGGRGITIYPQWLAYAGFVADMGLRPTPDHTLERINNDGPYDKVNCRWATRKEQARNQRTNRKLTYNGETLCVAEWAERIGLNRNALYTRLSLGWDVARALTTPSRSAV